MTRVLVVDDEPQILRALRINLRARRYDVTTAANGTQALDDLGPAGHDITVEIPEMLPAVRADPAILERVMVNLAENALRYSPAGKAPLLAASTLGDRVELRVVDRGPGIADDDKERMFVPFQRLGDTDNTTGVGLGLALSRGLTEAMGGTLTAEDTPGGGLTMTISLPAAPGD